MTWKGTIFLVTAGLAREKYALEMDKAEEDAIFRHRSDGSGRGQAQ